MLETVLTPNAPGGLAGAAALVARVDVIRAELVSNYLTLGTTSCYGDR